MLKIQEYLRNGHTLQQLSQRYNVQCNICSELNLVALNYGVLSPMSEEMVRECRGLFLELDTWDIACKSMIAFFESTDPIGYKTEKNINWNNAKLVEKLDGALICIYYYKNQWHIGMRMSADGSMQAVSINGTPTELSFAELTKLTLKEMGYDWNDYTNKLNPNIYYSFELTGPETRCGVVYPTRNLTLIGATNKETLSDIDIYTLEYPIEKAKYYEVHNLDEVNNYLQKYTDPLKYEGFVLVDDQYNRIKYKNSEYVSIMSNFTSDDELEALEELLMYVTTFSSTPPPPPPPIPPCVNNNVCAYFVENYVSQYMRSCGFDENNGIKNWCCFSPNGQNSNSLISPVTFENVQSVDSSEITTINQYIASRVPPVVAVAVIIRGRPMYGTVYHVYYPMCQVGGGCLGACGYYWNSGNLCPGTVCTQP